MSRGGFRPGAGRPKGVKNGEGRKPSKYRCEECFNCASCASPISAKRAGTTGKCGGCNSFIYGRLKGHATWVEHSCGYCGISYSGQVRNSYCTETCRRSANNEKRDIIRRMDAANDNVASHGVDVLERAGWRCEACGIDTPKELRGKAHPQAPEVDHIVPLARGGKHELSNLQCLCKRCNISKGVKLMSEWRPNAAIAA